MRYAHVLRTVAVAVPGALVGLTAPVASAGVSHSVEELSFVLEEQPALTAACGFPVRVEVAGSWNVVSFTDAAGDLTREIRNFRFRSVTSAHGVELVGRAVGPDIVTYHNDGSYTLVAHGSTTRKGAGSATVQLTVGRFVYIGDADGDEELVFEAGQENDLSVVCDLLG